MADCYLLVEKIKKSYMFSDDNYRHIHVRCVTLDKDYGHPRNISSLFDNEKPYRYFEDFVISCQMDDHTDHSYGYRFEYKDVYSIEYNKAEKMFKTLKSLNNKLNKYRDSQGHEQNFGEFVYRIGKAAKIKNIIFFMDYENIDSKYDNNKYEYFSLFDGAQKINEMANEMIKELSKDK